jgi:hypothetical protein
LKIFTSSSLSALPFANIPSISWITFWTGVTLAKGKADKEEEVKIFKEYSDWVHDEDRDAKLRIGSLKTKIEKLSAIRDKADAESDALATELGQLNEALAGFQTELDSATKLRTEEEAEYVANEKDLSESVDALDRAITVMKSRNYDVDQPGEFLQKFATTSRLQVELASFLQQPQGKQYAYEFQSGGIVELLKKFKKKFSKELYDTQTPEANSQHNFNLMKMNLEDEIANTKTSIEDRTQKKSAAEATAANAKKQLADTTADLKADEKYLADLRTTYKLKSNNFETNQGVRAEELEALTTAVEIISGGSAAASSFNLANISSIILITLSNGPFIPDASFAPLNILNAADDKNFDLLPNSC